MVEEKFYEYFNKWIKDLDKNIVNINSNSETYRESIYYEKMIELGKDALPFIIEKLDDGHFLLNHAISEITKLNFSDLTELITATLSEQEISTLWIDWWNENQAMPKISTSIAPWVLPNEEIPVYVYLNKTLSYSKIEIEIPDYCHVVETINILDYEQKDNHIIITKIGTFPFSKKDYFGLIITTDKIFDELAIKIPIKITLSETSGNLQTDISYARIFRPLIEINQIPREILLNEIDDTILPIHLKYKGFGDVSLRIECTVGGDIVTEGGSSPMDTIFYGLMKEGIVDDEFKEKTKSGIVVNKQKLLALLDEFKHKLRDKDYVKALENDKEIKKEAIDWLKSFNEIEQEKFMNPANIYHQYRYYLY